jgi:predicted membrane channel-forming protein YqfA (hemolysin III family)
MADQFLQTLQQALQRNAKSTALKSLGWLIALLLPSTIAASHYGNDKWLVVMLAILVCLSVVVYIAAYVFFALTNPDLLRSEKFTIQKMAIQQGIIGDDISGYIKFVKIGNKTMLADPNSPNIGKEGQ